MSILLDTRKRFWEMYPPWDGNWAALSQAPKEPRVPLLQTLKTGIGKAKIVPPRAKEQKQEQDISSQLCEECYEERC